MEKWFLSIISRIHHPTTPLPLSLIPEVLEELEHCRMKPECKQSIIAWLQESCLHIQREENLIEETIATVRGLFT